MASGLVLRVATVAVLVVLAAAVVLALRLRGHADGQKPVALGVWGHLEELRRRVLIVAAVLLAASAAALTIRVDMQNGWPVPSLALYDSLAAQLFAALVHDVVPAGVQVVALSPMDGFAAQLSLALGVGVLVALPVALDQAARFVAPALHAGERRLLQRTVLPALLLFVLGAAFAYAIVLPTTLAALYQFSEGLGAQNLLSARDLGSFVLSFLVGFGLAFQTPLVMVALTRAGLVEGRAFWRYWRHAVVVLLAVAMIVTPDPTVVSQLMLAVPLILLYVLGAAWASWVDHRGRAPLEDATTATASTHAKR